MEAFIVGCGDIGERVAALCQIRGCAVSALTRRPPHAERLRGAGITPFLGDLDRPLSLAGLPTRGAMVFYLAPPPDTGTADPRMRTFLGALGADAPPARIVYISTSGVYGDKQGAWVSEDTPPAPTSDRSRRRLDAETALLDWHHASGVPVVILRVGGIYGPGRLPLERLRRGEPVVREEECPYTNRIHADDLACVCIAAAELGRPGGIYNVSDGEPGTMTDYFNRVADRCGLPRPAQIPLSEARTRLSAAMLSYLEESRRLDTRRMREELGVELRYPDLARGLEACACG